VSRRAFCRLVHALIRVQVACFVNLVHVLDAHIVDEAKRERNKKTRHQAEYCSLSSEPQLASHVFSPVRVFDILTHVEQHEILLGVQLLDTSGVITSERELTGGKRKHRWISHEWNKSTAEHGHSASSASQVQTHLDHFADELASSHTGQ
jgi:hypothetical protein